MNTFVPYESFEKSAQALDDIRLNKQVAECAQILRVLNTWRPTKRFKAWSSHPAVRMWVGYDEALFMYTMACEGERLVRGMNKHSEISNLLNQFPEYRVTLLKPPAEVEMPPWWGGPIHESHQKVLAAKAAGVPQAEYRHLYVWP